MGRFLFQTCSRKGLIQKVLKAIKFHVNLQLRYTVSCEEAQNLRIHCYTCYTKLTLSMSKEDLIG